MPIKAIFRDAEQILGEECKRSQSNDFRRQYEIIRSRRWDKVTDEAGILNTLVVQSASYSVVRKYFQIYYQEDLSRLDEHYLSHFFESGSAPFYSCREWTNIALTWGNTILTEEDLPKQSTLDELVNSLKRAHSHDWTSYTKRPRPRIVLSLATALPRVGTQILNDPSGFLLRHDKISATHPGQAYDLASTFSKGLIEMGPALICNFFKELGLLHYVKIDVHLSEFMSTIALCKTVSGKKEQFVLSWLLAREAGMEPFFLDKILYVGGKYAKPRLTRLLEEKRGDYMNAVNDLMSEVPRYM